MRCSVPAAPAGVTSGVEHQHDLIVRHVARALCAVGTHDPLLHHMLFDRILDEDLIRELLRCGSGSAGV